MQRQRLQEVEDELQAEREAHQQSLLEQREQESSLKAALAIEQSCVSNVSSPHSSSSNSLTCSSRTHAEVSSLASVSTLSLDVQRRQNPAP